MAYKWEGFPGKAAAFDYYPRLSKIRDHCRRHGVEGLTLQVAAGIAGLEESYFSTFFHAKTGVCFHAWVNHQRVRRAVELMATRDLSITELAFESGFGDLRTFERVFERIKGSTPSKYRTSVRPRPS